MYRRLLGICCGSGMDWKERREVRAGWTCRLARSNCLGVEDTQSSLQPYNIFKNLEVEPEVPSKAHTEGKV